MAVYNIGDFVHTSDSLYGGSGVVIDKGTLEEIGGVKIKPVKVLKVHKDDGTENFYHEDMSAFSISEMDKLIGEGLKEQENVEDNH
jgi:hypothetical protein